MEHEEVENEELIVPEKKRERNTNKINNLGGQNKNNV